MGVAVVGGVGDRAIWTVAVDGGKDILGSGFLATGVSELGIGAEGHCSLEGVSDQDIISRIDKLERPIGKVDIGQLFLQLVHKVIPSLRHRGCKSLLSGHLRDHFLKAVLVK